MRGEKGRRRARENRTTDIRVGGAPAVGRLPFSPSLLCLLTGMCRPKKLTSPNSHTCLFHNRLGRLEPQPCCILRRHVLGDAPERFGADAVLIADLLQRL